MGRIIPWDLPKINGGSVGGYTPEPTPEPPAPPEPEVVGPYGFDDAVIIPTSTSITMSGSSGSVTKDKQYTVSSTDASKIKPTITVSGIKINDSSNVSQVIAHCIIRKESWDISITPDTSTAMVEFVDCNLDIDITSAMSTLGGAVTKDSLTSSIIYIGTSAGSFSKRILTLPKNSLELLYIDVYSANGVILQQYIIEEEPEEEEE